MRVGRVLVKGPIVVGPLSPRMRGWTAALPALPPTPRRCGRTAVTITAFGWWSPTAKVATRGAPGSVRPPSPRAWSPSSGEGCPPGGQVSHEGGRRHKGSMSEAASRR